MKFFKILQLNFKSQCKLRVGKQILWQLGGMSELAANSGIIKISLALYKSDCDRHWTLNTLFFLTIYDKVAMWRCVMPFSLPSLKKNWLRVAMTLASGHIGQGQWLSQYSNPGVSDSSVHAVLCQMWAMWFFFFRESQKPIEKWFRQQDFIGSQNSWRIE